jgi:predicted nucleic acid-binding protein
VALIDADDRHHQVLGALFREDPAAWVVPWAVLPEVDYLLATQLGSRTQGAFLADLARGEWAVEWGQEADVVRAHEIDRKYRALRLGLVDAVVMAMAERLRVSAIATLDLRHFGSVAIGGNPRLLPRDL